MMPLLDLPIEILAYIPLPGIQSKDVVRACRQLHEVFTPQLYREVWFDKAPRHAGQSPEIPYDVRDVTHPPGMTPLRSPRAIHLWFHTICVKPQLQWFIRRLWLLSDLTLADLPQGIRAVANGAPSAFPPSQCEINMCRRHDWSMLARLPNLAHAVITAYWTVYFVSSHAVLPALQTLHSASARRCRPSCLRDVWHLHHEWDVLDVMKVATQPALRELTIAQARITKMDDADPILDVQAPARRMTSLLLDRVEVHPSGAAMLFRPLRSLRTFRWRRVPHICTWQNCQCNDSLVAELRCLLHAVAGSLHLLHLEVHSRAINDLQSRRCVRDRQVLHTLDFLTQLDQLMISPEFLLGRQTCHRQSLLAPCERQPAEQLASKLPASIKRLILFVDVVEAQYECEYRQALVEGILRQRTRLAALEQITIEDIEGCIDHHDTCGQCATYGSVPQVADLTPQMKDCEVLGIKLVYHPNLGQPDT